MDRKEFLSLFGVGAVAAVCSYCLAACKVPGQSITAPTGVDFTLDLTNPLYSGLKTVGGYVYNNGVIVAHAAGGYVAVSSACTHQGNTIYYDVGSNLFVCPAHGSRFGTDGSVVNGPAAAPLGRYNTSLNGNLLRVYS